MKKNLILSLCFVLTMMSFALAGPYSTGLADTNNAVDPGVPGFVDGAVNPLFVAWASECVDYSPAPGVAANWTDTTKVLGPVTGSNMDIVVLGDLNTDQIAEGLAQGEITLGFDVSICDGTGADFAVFENGFMSGTKLFAELAYVEVSTDGLNFARFPSVSLTEGLVGGYGTIDPTDVYNLAGKHVNAYGNSYGTPFDLTDLINDPLVLSDVVDLNEINYIKMVDIPGSGDFLDSLGNPIYDAWVTWGSGGLDLEAVGVINAAVPEPSTILLLVSLAAAALFLRRQRVVQDLS